MGQEVLVFAVPISVPSDSKTAETLGRVTKVCEAKTTKIAVRARRRGASQALGGIAITGLGRMGRARVP